MSKNQRLNATITIGSVLEQSVKKNIGFLKSGLHSVGDGIKTVERRQRELGKQRKILERQGKSVDALDRDYEDLTHTLDRLRRTQERWNRAAGASRRVGSTFSAMTADIGRNARRVAIGVGLAGGAIFGLASSTADAAKEIKNLSQVANTSPLEFQRMAAAVGSVGIEQEKLGDILKDVNDRVGDFIQTGGGPMADFFENIAPKVGVTIDQFKELSGKDALLLYVDSLEKAGVSQQEMTFFLEAMAGDASLLIPLLQDNGRELERLEDKAEAAGRILSGKALQSANEFREELTTLQGTFTGLRHTVGAELMPVVTGAMRQIGDALLGNREQVKVWATSFADGVEHALPVIGDLVTGIGRVTTVVGGVVASTVDMVGGWENFGIIIGAVLASKTIIRIGKFAGAVFSLGRAMFALTAFAPMVAGGIRLVGAALIANPIGIAVAAIAAGAALIYTNWGKIKPMLRPVIDWMGEKFTWLWENAGKPLLDGLKFGVEGVGAAWQVMKTMLGAVIDWLGEKFDWAMGKIKPVIDALKWVKGEGGSVFDGMSDADISAQNNKPTAKQILGLNSRQPAAQPNFIQIGAGQPPVQTNALGGAYGRGWHLTGEKGPELKFENRAGYVADNRAMRQLASHADRVSNIFGNNGSARPTATNPTSGVTQQMTIHINAAGASAADVIAILDRRTRSAAQGALFDRPSLPGAYGR